MNLLLVGDIAEEYVKENQIQKNVDILIKIVNVLKMTMEMNTVVLLKVQLFMHVIQNAVYLIVKQPVIIALFSLMKMK